MITRKYAIKLLLLISTVSVFSCKKMEEQKETVVVEKLEVDSIIEEKVLEDILEIEQSPTLITKAQLSLMPDTALVDVLQLDSTFVLDVKYATTDNFTKQVLYPCQRCLLRKEVAIALVKVHTSVKRQGFYIKLFDCYRPNSVQWKMWEIFPDDRYVANPAKGSVHNRGGAVDLSLTDELKNEIDMGSPYDFFGPKSHFANTNLADSIIELRQLLRLELEKEGFGGITSEWWHFSYRNKEYRVLDEPLCDM